MISQRRRRVAQELELPPRQLEPIDKERKEALLEELGDLGLAIVPKLAIVLVAHRDADEALGLPVESQDAVGMVGRGSFELERRGGKDDVTADEGLVGVEATGGSETDVVGCTAELLYGAGGATEVGDAMGSPWDEGARVGGRIEVVLQPVVVVSLRFLAAAEDKMRRKEREHLLRAYGSQLSFQRDDLALQSAELIRVEDSVRQHQLELEGDEDLKA